MKKTVFGVNLRILGITSLALILFILLPAFFFMDSLYYEVNSRDLFETARAVAFLSGDYLSDFFEKREQTTSEPAWFNSIRENTPFRITLIYPDGKVGADSHLDIKGMENHLSRPEVKEALLGKHGNAQRQSVSIGKEQIYTALPVRSGSEEDITGVFRLSRDIPSFAVRISSSALPFIIIALIVLAAAFFAVYFFSRSISRAFKHLNAVTQTGDAAARINLQEDIPFISETEEFIKAEASLRDMAMELRSRIDQAMIESRRLEAIVNGMSEAVFAAGSDLNLILINRRARSLFDIRETAGLSLLEASGSTELENAAKKVLAEFAPHEFEMKCYRNGRQISFSAFASPIGITSNSGNITEGVVIVLNDITRLQKLEQVRKDFAANVSHELRTPIQVIKGFSEIILDILKPEAGPGGEISAQNTGQLINSVEIIFKNAKTMENLTNDLLSLVSLEDEEGGRPPMAFVEAESLMKEAVQAVEIQRQKKNISIHESCPANLSAKLHGPFIVQALINLLDNAIKYSPSGAGVWFSAAMGENDASQGGQEIIFTVKDEGIGIPAEHQGRLFERFYRVDKARSREAGGTGLGLSIVRHIALLHNGKAEVSSHAGEGSVFTIRIPQDS
jgi:two-component system phosphate regulon sensor histidine kinase PhoR